MKTIRVMMLLKMMKINRDNKIMVRLLNTIQRGHIPEFNVTRSPSAKNYVQEVTIVRKDSALDHVHLVDAGKDLHAGTDTVSQLKNNVVLTEIVDLSKVANQDFASQHAQLQLVIPTPYVSTEAVYKTLENAGIIGSAEGTKNVGKVIASIDALMSSVSEEDVLMELVYCHLMTAIDLFHQICYSSYIQSIKILDSVIN